MEVAEDPMAGTDHTDGLALDQPPKGVPIAGKHRLDDGAITGQLVRSPRARSVLDGDPPTAWIPEAWVPGNGPHDDAGRIEGPFT